MCTGVPGSTDRHGAADSSGFRALAGACAVAITGHDVPMLLGVADQVIWETAGTTYSLGPPDAVEAHDQFRREYLGRWP